MNLAGFSGYPSGPGFLKFPRAWEVSRNRSLAWRRGVGKRSFGSCFLSFGVAIGFVI